MSSAVLVNTRSTGVLSAFSRFLFSLSECIRFAAARLWRGIREWCGDAAYERYLKTHGKRGCGAPALTREQFYLDQLQKRYSRINRCC